MKISDLTVEHFHELPDSCKEALKVLLEAVQGQAAAHGAEVQKAHAEAVKAGDIQDVS